MSHIRSRSTGRLPGAVALIILVLLAAVPARAQALLAGGAEQVVREALRARYQAFAAAVRTPDPHAVRVGESATWALQNRWIALAPSHGPTLTGPASFQIEALTLAPAGATVLVYATGEFTFRDAGGRFGPAGRSDALTRAGWERDVWVQSGETWALARSETLSLGPLLLDGVPLPAELRKLTPPGPRLARILIPQAPGAGMNPEAIRARMRQKSGMAYDPAAAERDRQAIQDMGYFQGEVGLRVAPDPAGGVDETYIAVENPLVRSIEFIADTPDGRPSVPADTLRNLMQTKSGQRFNIFNRNLLGRDLDNLFDRQTGYMRAKGYITDYTVPDSLDPATGALTIHLIESRIGAIRLTGNARTPVATVLGQMHSMPGAVFNDRVLQWDIERLSRTGLFASVGPAELADAPGHRIVITLPLVEK